MVLMCRAGCSSLAAWTKVWILRIFCTKAAQHVYRSSARCASSPSVFVVFTKPCKMIEYGRSLRMRDCRPRLSSCYFLRVLTILAGTRRELSDSPSSCGVHDSLSGILYNALNGWALIETARYSS